jgi:PPM family protein phosphatase
MASLEVWGDTDRGLVRANNQDSWHYDPDTRLALVADGMGGAACGEVASAITVETIAEVLRGARPVESPAARLEYAIQEANRRVRERTRIEEACRGMGSTVVAAYWDLPDVAIANVGDSRAYLWRDNTLQQLSYDQTVANELRRRMGLSESEATGFPHRHVLTMAIGSAEELMVCATHVRVQPGDQLLLCSDGLSGPVSEEVIAAILSSGEDIPLRVQHLMEAARTAGGPDNITAVLLAVRD